MRWSVTRSPASCTRADLLAPPAAAHLVLPGRRGLGCLAVLLRLQQLQAQDLQRLGPVLELALLVLHRDDDARRLVGDPHRGVDGVDALAAGPGRPVDVDLQIIWVELDVDLLGLGQDHHRGRRRVDPALALGDELRAARGGGASCFMRLQTPSPLTRNVTSLKPPMSDSAAQHVDAPAHPGRVALVHPEQIASEQVGLLTTLGAADLHDHVLAVVGVLREQEQLQLLGEAFDVGLVARPRRATVRDRRRQPRGGAPWPQPDRRCGASDAIARRSARARGSGEQPPGSAAGRRSARVAERLELSMLSLEVSGALQHDHRAYGGSPAPVAGHRNDLRRLDQTPAGATVIG